jgi:monoterpene epsilon-lactone hydrolase
VEGERKGQDLIGELMFKGLKDKVDYTPVLFDSFEAEWAIPLEKRGGGAILYLHGGAYVAGSLTYAKVFGGVLADATGRNTLCAAYRLAPEHPYPAALDDALFAYRHMLTEYDACDIMLAGESAGGGLCYCLLLKIKEEGLPLPAGVVTISPWTDLTCSGGSYETNAFKDPTLYADGLKYYAWLYAKDNTQNPYVSPIYGDFTGCPPSMIFAGTHELLEDDARGLAKRLAESGCACELNVVEGMWHVYVLYKLKESKEAMKQIRAFVNTCLPHH